MHPLPLPGVGEPLPGVGAPTAAILLLAAATAATLLDSAGDMPLCRTGFAILHSEIATFLAKRLSGLMFTGIVETRGRLLRRRKTPAGYRLWIEAPELAAELSPGASIAVNGVCLTVVETAPAAFCVDVIPETLRKTTLGRLRRGAVVNLERALLATGRFDGHIVCGHVDCVSRVRAVEHSAGEHSLWIALPAAFQQYAILHGSICVDGVSLTIARLRSDAFMVALIPTTLERTTLGQLRPGSWVNLEFDILAKYIESLLRPYLRLFFQNPPTP